MTIWNVLLTIAISATPFVELRGGIPFALSQGLSPAAAFALALLGNLAVVPVLLWGLEWIERLFMRWRFTRRILESVFARSRRKGRWIEQWGVVGLLLLVAIPLPGTGAWTGALAARLIGLPNKKSLPWIALGVVIAGVFVLFASLGVIHLFGLGTVT
ncbi:small multi-drug export protein [Candidatus Bipolaricaulota bacterium]|nr:small multi-drug export protein [Candidatus Bipolaricaulota bacterium]